MEDKKQQTETIYIPQEVRDLPLSAFPLSTRLNNVLRDSDFRLVGDLHGFPVKNLKTLPNCGAQTVSELRILLEKIQQGEFKVEMRMLQTSLTSQELNLSRLVEFIDEFLNRQSPREQAILSLRFGANGTTPLTLEEIGEKYGLTRERIRQIQSYLLSQLKYRLGEAGEKLFEQVSGDCLAALCPLTPQLLAFWTQKNAADFSFSPSFYVRLLAELAPEIPTLPEGQIIGGRVPKGRAPRIIREIKSLLGAYSTSVSLVKVFEELKKIIENLSEKEFLDALQFGSYLALTFDAPDKPKIKLTAKRRVSEIANQILSASDRPLTPKEIIERAQGIFGDAVTLSMRSLNNLLYYAEEFYLLDNWAMGLRKHFRLSPERWEELRNDFFELLKKHNRSFSTPEVIGRQIFSWTKIVNASEAAEILREDARFTDLGRFHFALSEWGIEEREYIRDLIVKVLRETDQPLTAAQVAEKIQNLRSLAWTSMSSALRQHKAVKDYGFGFYGLQESKDDYREFLVSNREFVNRAVTRSEPPLTFGDLCRKLEIAETGILADKLWRTLRTLSKIRFKPNNQTPETILVHTNWRLERAIQKVLGQAERPLSAYEIQWELNEVFGKTFDDKNLDSIKSCLQNDELFVRNSQGAYLLFF